MSKKTRMRACPAAGTSIEAYECAAGRHSKYRCPEACPFNPFSVANYEAYLQVEGTADKKLFEWMLQTAPNRAEFESQIRKLLEDDDLAAYFRFFSWNAVYRRNAAGESCVSRWAKAGFPDLTQDEQVLMRGRCQMQPALLEVHQVLDDKCVEVVDLLASGTTSFRVVDRGLAQQALRFAVYVSDIVALPHYSRIFGTCLELSDIADFEPVEVLHEISQHLGGPRNDAGLRHWLAENHAKFSDALRAVGQARRHALFEELDAKFGQAIYQITKSFEDCRARLDSASFIEEGELDEKERAEGFVQARDWLALPEDPEHEFLGDRALLGRISLGGTHWRLEGIGAAKLDKMRERFEQLMGDSVKFAGERRDDLGARMRMKESDYDRALVPPALVRNPPKLFTASSKLPIPAGPGGQEIALAEFKRQQDLRFLEDKVPALENRTPREAAVLPDLRPKLVRLMKDRVKECDRKNLETGDSDDVDWMLRELGLTELLFPMPPPRPPTKPSGLA